MKKVLHIINSLSTGGAEKLMVDILPLLKKEIDVDLLILRNGKSNFFINELRNSNITIISLNSKNIYNPFIVFRLKKFLRRYNIIHVHLFPSLYWTVLAFLILRIDTRLIYTEHSTHNRRRNILVLKGIEKWIYSYYSYIICISSSVKQNLLIHLGQKFEARIKVINNGVDIKKFTDAKPLQGKSIPWRISRDNVTVLMVARFSKSKDHETLIKSFSYLDTRYQLILVGECENMDNCINLAKKLNLYERINFIGVRQNIPELMKTADICVLSSHWEGFGIAAVEAMASGTPLIASNVPGLAEIVEDGGILFEKGNSIELANCIKKISNNPDLYNQISKRSIQRSKTYCIENMAERYLDLYIKVL